MRQDTKIFAFLAVFCLGLVARQTRTATRDQTNSRISAVQSCKEIERNVIEPEKNLTWVHPPKTGTSAANLLYRYACDVPSSDQVRARLPHVYLREKYPPEKMCSKLHNKTQHRFGLHDAIGSSKYGISYEELQGGLVISLRSNEARLWSSFMHSVRNKRWGSSYGCYTNIDSIQDFQPGRLPQLFKSYVQLNSVKDCQTKMLVGRHCCDESRVTEDEFQVALGRLKNATYLIITDHWELSACIFLQRFGGENLSIYSFNTRRGSPQKSIDKVRNKAHKISQSMMRNHFDEKLFKFGLNIFNNYEEKKCCIDL
ncbi:unknown protein [Bathycoccus prasinos]|uniref:Sulfotransferase n=1 Tax=Bathycoccus prasinos TaxID=41875 RepID=K8FDV1_9CHLO|nr:unknown protein [Bathycoccus prasinos]CCO20808.1 unknown protein [Bathycoccus prasinos]|eukprot:XP_007508089.1 unknown protein [Bathycoccus prasinos]